MRSDANPLAPPLEACILAGGLSRRMGRDKAALRWQGRTFLSHIRQAVQECGLPLRIIRRDLVPQCGPLGGIFTALKTSPAGRVLFLACDMPFISSACLRAFLDEATAPEGALFLHSAEGAGFPFLLPVQALARVEEQLEKKHFSLQALAGTLEATEVRLPERWGQALLNINTPQDWARVRKGKAGAS